MLRRVRGQGDSDSEAKSKGNSSIVSMQMGDSEDKGGQTAQFGLGPGHSSIFSNREPDSQHALVDEISQTFTTLRDFKRKEALEVLVALIMQAKA